jgi:hypothetical protein
LPIADWAVEVLGYLARFLLQQGYKSILSKEIGNQKSAIGNGFDYLVPKVIGLCGFDVIRQSCGFRDGQSILAHAFQVEFNRFAHALSHFFDGFARGDTAREVRQISRIVSFARFDDHYVTHNVKLYFFNPA